MPQVLGTEGETLVGDVQFRGIIGAAATSREANSPGLLHLQTWNGTTFLDFYIWVSATGVLRGQNAIPTNQASDGVVLGANAM